MEEIAIEAQGNRRVERAARPIIKWVGGKARLLPELRARMPATFGRYFEPFAGGAALFFDVAPKRAVLADSNADLMGMYRALATDVETLIGRLDEHAVSHGERHYRVVRDAWNVNRHYDLADRAAAFIYLNKTCFNGLWRVNRSGKMNVSWGNHASFRPDVDNLRAASAALARAELMAGDYRTAIADARRGDFVFMDPPYDGAFGSYTTSGFTDVDQAELAYTARSLVARGCKVMLSNADTPRVRALYAGMRIDVVQRPGTLSCKGSGRGAVNEVIVTAGYER